MYPTDISLENLSSVFDAGFCFRIPPGSDDTVLDVLVLRTTMILMGLSNVGRLCLGFHFMEGEPAFTNVLTKEEYFQTEELSTQDILRHLKTVRFDSFSGSESEFYITLYLLENAPIMEKMDIFYAYEMRKDLTRQAGISETLMALNKVSSLAEIFLLVNNLCFSSGVCMSYFEPH
ncbi:hypothetical protein IFM89_011013 [Coptis chinensis]|uniref:FBD domain-containing protein n=1 Tax=Coptis chinensis TaxID=261450 RepID=A0A835IRE6_9MAGN|nr:hypothetical protein IFM89_011013 [Coptis chinensis]